MHLDELMNIQKKIITVFKLCSNKHAYYSVAKLCYCYQLMMRLDQTLSPRDFVRMK